MSANAIIIRQLKRSLILKFLIMNRIVFVGLCLVGLMVFVLANADLKLEEQPKTEVAKQNSQLEFN